MDIAKILKDVPKGTKLYSPAFGDVILEEIRQDYIRVRTNNIKREFYSDGRYYANGECMLFPSRENRDWNTFKKFDINTLKPFDKVIARDASSYKWTVSFFSHLKNTGFKFVCSSDVYKECIPYNDETKHLVGTTGDCPEYYKTW